jgi:hypothetical protein
MMSDFLHETLVNLSDEERYEFVRTLPEEHKAKLSQFLTQTQAVWTPLPGPQSLAKDSEADILFYGGSAGGGKTDLCVGMAVTEHKKSIIFRREATQLTGIIDRLTEIIGNRNGFNGQEKIWRMTDRQIEFGSVPNPGNETKYQGRPHDLIVFDEISNFLEGQFRFLMGWLRTTTPGQRCRVICAGNPPTSSDGDWVRKFWGAWLDPHHPDPAKPGELRWYYSFEGKDYAVEDGSPIVFSEGKPRKATQEEIDSPLVEVITPKSRTFIPSRVTDNPYLMGTGYMATLQALPEPLRSQMLYGDFTSGQEDDAWQVIPSEWVRAAQRRYKEHPAYRVLHTHELGSHGYQPVMTSIGVDVSRGGQDESIIAMLYDNCFYDELECIPGNLVSDGPTLGAEILKLRKNHAPVHIDAIGVGTSVSDWLESQNIQVEGVTGNEKGWGRDSSGKFKFKNRRAETWWKLRESLDPKSGSKICLPPDGQLLADLCAPRYKIGEGNVIQIESKPDLKKRLGRSPDRGDAIAYASINTPLAFTRPFTDDMYRYGSGGKRVKRGASWK